MNEETMDKDYEFVCRNCGCTWLRTFASVNPNMEIGATLMKCPLCWVDD